MPTPLPTLRVNQALKPKQLIVLGISWVIGIAVGCLVFLAELSLGVRTRKNRLGKPADSEYEMKGRESSNGGERRTSIAWRKDNKCKAMIS